MLAPPQALVSMLEPWATFYGDSSLLQTAVTFTHLGGLLLGGGVAIATDRVTLRLSSDVERRRHLLEMSHQHRFVVGALAAVVISGILLVTADIEAFWSSPVYWIKMALVVALLVNGARMRAIETAATTDPVPSATHWRAFRGSAIASLTLWLAITAAGVALINYV